MTLFSLLHPSTIAYWGKTASRFGTNAGASSQDVHPLVCHGLDVAAVGAALLERDTWLRQRICRTTHIPDDHLIAWILFFLAIHDIGKFSQQFQCLQLDVAQSRGVYIEAPQYMGLRHDSFGYIIFEKVMLDLILEKSMFFFHNSDRETHCDIFKFLAPPFFGHHGRPPRSDEKIIFSTLFTSNDREACCDYTTAVGSFFLDTLPAYEQPDDDTLDLILDDELPLLSFPLAGLTVLCDWIASASFPFYNETELDIATYFSNARKHAETYLEQSGMLIPPPSTTTAFHDLFPQIKQPPRPLQNYALTTPISKDDPSLFILEDTTGSGKTEAAVILAHRLMQAGAGEGIYFALPTMATANGMYERMVQTYDRLFAPGSSPSLILAHGKAHLSTAFTESIGLERAALDQNENSEPELAYCANWLADNRKKCMLAAIGVGTIDQALLSILPVKHQSLRLIGLSRNILIVDEVHACDAYVFNLLKSLLQFHAALGGSAIVLSATLPQKMRRELVKSFTQGRGISINAPQKEDYPLATKVTATSKEPEEAPIQSCIAPPRHVSVDFVRTQDDMHNAALQAAQAGACVCIIRNTVNDAMTTYTALQALHAEEVLLFHARFALEDRLAIEQQVLKRFGKNSPTSDRRGVILVATQVVEQSLDLDFDYILTDLAPIELLFQRAGRGMRHNRDDRPAGFHTPRLTILSPEPIENAPDDWYTSFSSGSAMVYPYHGRLWLTAKRLEERGGFTLPTEARNCIEAVYNNTYEDHVPSSLRDRDDKALGEDYGKISTARRSALHCNEGYTSEGIHWGDDENPQTRLGEETVTLRLCRWDNNTLIPWSTDPDSARAWALSDIRIRLNRYQSIPQAAPNQATTAMEAWETARTTMPGKGKWVIPIVLAQETTNDSKNVWCPFRIEPTTKDDKTKPSQKTYYSSQYGLLIEK